MKQLQISYNQDLKVWVAGPTTASSSSITMQATFANEASVFSAIQSSLHPQSGWVFRASATVISDRISLSAVNLAQGEQIRFVSSREPVSVVFSDISTGSGGGSGASSEEIQELREAIAELRGSADSDSASSPEIDSQSEVNKFLEGYENTDSLKDIISQSTKIADPEHIEDLFN